MSDLISDLVTPLDPPAPQRLCPDCKVELERMVSGFSFSENPGSLFADNIMLDLYSCPRCGLIRFYSFKHRIAQESAAKRAAQADSPPPSKPEPDGPADPWEKPGFFRRKKDKPDWEG